MTGLKKQVAALALAGALAAPAQLQAQQPQTMSPETMLTLARVGTAAFSPDGA